MQGVPLTPPIRFGTVAFPSPGAGYEWDSESDDERRVASFTGCLYRGAYPKHRNLRFLQTLHLRTIVSLTPKPIDIDPTLAQWARENNGGAGIRLVHIRTEKPKEESGGLSREGAARAIAVTLDRENLPMYIHCLDGVEATSTFVACIRRLQGWSDLSIREEFARGLFVATTHIGGAPFEVPRHLAHFVERFGQPDGVRIPPLSRLPSWLWPSVSQSYIEAPITVQHNSIKLHFEPERAVTGSSLLSGVVWSTATAHKANTPSWLTLSDASERGSCGHLSDADLEEPHKANDSNLSPYGQDNIDLCTPRAKPTLVEGDVPPLAQTNGQRAASVGEESPVDMLTPLVKPSDTRIPTNDVPDIDQAADADAIVELDEEDDMDDEEIDEDIEDEDEDARRIEALNLEGF